MIRKTTKPDTRTRRPRACRTIVAILLSTAPGPVAVAQSFYYDDAGRLSQVAYRNGNGIRYQYDDADNMTAVTPLELPPAPILVNVVQVSPTTARLVWRDDSDREGSFLIMRRRSDDLGWETIAVVGANVTSFLDGNLDPDTDYVYRIVAQGDQGLSAYSGELSPVPAGPAGSFLDLVVQMRGAETASTLGDPGTPRPGYAEVTVNAGPTPYGTAVFSLAQNGVVVGEAGVPASPPSDDSRIFIDFRTGVEADSNQFQGTISINTGLAVANTSGQDATVTYRLRDRQGALITEGTGALAAGAHFAKFINQIVEEAPAFQLPANFPTAVQFGTLDVSSDQPLSVLALRLTSNQRGETLLTTTPVADLNQAPSSQPLYFPQFADGQGFVSALVLLNVTDRRQNGTIRLFGNDGSPFEVRPTGGGRSSVFAYSIPADGAFVFQTDGSTPIASAGWALLTPDPGNTTPLGSGVFELSQSGVVVTESGIPSAGLTTHARIFIDTTEGHNTGLAISNPGDSDLPITLGTFETDGSPTASPAPDPIILEPGGHRAMFVTQLAPGLPADFTGVLELEAADPFAALTLRSLTNTRNEFLLTTFPIADLTRPAPEPIVFPQIADGGGIRTQFILINPGSDSVVTIRFFSDDGSPLTIGEAQ